MHSDRITPACRAGGSRRAATRRLRGGTIINVITAVIFFGLIGCSIWWIIKTAGQAGQQYTTAMINTSEKATTLTCQMNMRSIFQNLQTYAISNEHFPDSQQELVDFGGYTKLFRCPDPNGSTFVYIPGLRPDMATTAVVVYEPKPVHQGRCNVLLLGGQIEALTPDELTQAIEATTAHLRSR